MRYSSATTTAFLSHATRGGGGSRRSRETVGAGATSDSGFTLVEMLVALAALAILATGGVMLTGVATDTSDQLREHQANTVDLLRLHAALNADLSQTAPRRARDEAGVKPPSALSGQPVTRSGVFLRLVRRGWDNPLEERRASLQYVEYRLRDGNLERLWRRHVDGAPLQAPQLLIENVQTVRVSYFEFDQWIDNWTGAPNRPLPRAVRVEVDIAGRGAITQTFLLPEVAP